MSDFLTEKEIEDLLILETRQLTMPDGKTVPVNGFKLMWNSFDLLQEAGMFTAELLIELAHSWSEREGIPFDTTLKNICGYAHEQASKL
jgi:hypothetical protein